jgi:hypothetical protein
LVAGMQAENVCKCMYCVDHAKMLQEFLTRMIFLKFAVCNGASVLREDVSACKPDPHSRFEGRADGMSTRVALKDC